MRNANSAARPTRRRGTRILVAGLTSVGLMLTACGSEDPGPDGEEPTSVPESVFEGKDVGAMDDYGVGTTFKATEPVEFSLFYRDHPNYPLKEDWRILTALEENQNVTFDITAAPLSDWGQRQATVIGAGTDVPQIISVTYPGQEVSFISGGAILPVSDYLDYLPNFKDKVEKWGLSETIDTALRQEDGKFYLLPGIRETPRAQYSYAVRADVWEELGLSLQPETFEEFADQLRTVKEAHPDAFPLSDRWSANGPLEATLNFAAASFGTSAGWGYGEGVTWNEEAGEFEYTGATDEYKSLVEYYAMLVEEGLMDPESLIQEDDQAIQKFGSGQSMAIAGNDQEVLKYRTTFEELGTDAEVAMIRVPAGPAGDKYAAGTRLQSGLMLSSDVADSENFMALLQFIDWLYYSDEGLEFAKWGIEGETYTKAADGTRTLAEDIDINGLNPGAPKALNVDFGFHNGVWMLEHGSTTDLDLSMLRPEVVEFVEAMNTKEELPLPPAAPLTELEREQASLWQTSLRDHVLQNTSLFILGQRPMSEWDAYVAELEGMNLQQYLDMFNEAQKRYAEGE
ncbi:extracellular solute-binding protein [Tessaracoccus sp. OS52]|uniref:ABC transporter substrate-binding protein n=1 Tax=Tessaracoccus sp. OS52 TaxID=2886691 RepID=UPI001D11C042|nr:extracellular solute-binding protein [Tessaracoccus sp. OS52]MCC2593743.1 extracellular solute-binding protein [Tessaracoccus sp. OS52]